MDNNIKILAILSAACVSLSAEAHVSYTGRNFGAFDSNGGSTTISNQTASGNYGWADGLDADFGDSHRLRAFRFTLTDTVNVTFTVEANPTATPTSVGGLLPGFSIYSGLAHLPPFQADHDFSVATRPTSLHCPVYPRKALSAP